MPKPTDIRPVAASLYFLPIRTRIPLKFGPEITTEVTCARVRLTVADRAGRTAFGWGETPLSVQWVWPSSLSYAARHQVLQDFTIRLVHAWSDFNEFGHALEVGHSFTSKRLPVVLTESNRARQGQETMPWLAALVCSSAFDIALHDAFGQLHDCKTYDTYTSEYISHDLSAYLQPAQGSSVSFEGQFPADFLVNPAPTSLVAWHLVGGKDPIAPLELTGSEPNDGYPVVLRDWIRHDGLKCLKVKLRGDDFDWDYQRLTAIGRLAIEENVDWLSTDFNCTVREPAYVNQILDRLLIEEPRIYAMILYVEQPFPYDLEANPMDVRSVVARKPLFMDESAHDWELIRLGRSLGWSGVALKTCKTQTGALLSLCWAKAHGMTLMVQDLTNPMLAQIPHVLLAAHADTIMGVETNAMQFYPDASDLERKIHPGLYKRNAGRVDFSTLDGAGFGYCVDDIARPLPNPVAVSGQ